MEQSANIVGSENQTGQAKAVILQPKRKPTNPNGNNQFTFEKSLTPYSVKYCLADTLIKQGKTIKYTCQMTGLSPTTVMRVKKGEIKLASEWVANIKKQESAKHTFLSNTILDAITSEDISKASLLQKVTSSSILIDKRRILDGEPGIIVNHLANLDNLSAMVNDLNNTSNKINALEAEQITDNQSLSVLEQKQDDVRS
jgi:hypothetical protein